MSHKCLKNLTSIHDRLLFVHPVLQSNTVFSHHLVPVFSMTEHNADYTVISQNLSHFCYYDTKLDNSETNVRTCVISRHLNDFFLPIPSSFVA